MNKFWVFVEGDSEEEYIKNFLQIKLSDKVYISKNIFDFVKSNLDGADFYGCYIENCESINKIPHKINELYYLIEQSDTNKILIIGDVERLPCYSSRRDAILNILEDSIDTSNIKFIFSKPTIEVEYWNSTDLIIRVVQLEYKEKFKISTSILVNIPPNTPKNIYGLKCVFNSLNVKYRESKFAKKFFPRCNFDCDIGSINRTREILSDFMS